jgi:hypothetical protein
MDAQAIIDALRRSRTEADGGGGSIPSGHAFGGRVGVDVPLSDDASLRMGMAGSVVNAKDFKKRMLTGLDAEYRKANQALGLELRRQSPGGFFDGQAFPGNPDQVWLKYRREF